MRENQPSQVKIKTYLVRDLNDIYGFYFIDAFSKKEAVYKFLDKNIPGLRKNIYSVKAFDGDYFHIFYRYFSSPFMRLRVKESSKRGKESKKEIFYKVLGKIGYCLKKYCNYKPAN